MPSQAVLRFYPNKTAMFGRVPVRGPFLRSDKAGEAWHLTPSAVRPYHRRRRASSGLVLITSTQARPLYVASDQVEEESIALWGEVFNDAEIMGAGERRTRELVPEWLGILAAILGMGAVVSIFLMLLTSGAIDFSAAFQNLRGVIGGQ